MVCLRFTSHLLQLVIFFSLLAAQGQGKQASKEEIVKRMGMGGRKLGAHKEMVEGEGTILNTGKAKSSSEKLFCSTTSNTIAKDKYSRGSSMKPVESTETQLSYCQISKTSSTHDCNETPPKAPLDPFETMNTDDKLLRATREILNMMNKDYQTKPRPKPPINNHHRIPLEQP